MKTISLQLTTMNKELDADFLSSVESLSLELQILEVDHEVLTDSKDVACDSLLETAWLLVHFIHRNSVAGTSKSTNQNERENKLRDELQTAQTELHRCKDRLDVSKQQIKSLELTSMKLKAKSLKWQETAESLNIKVKQLESKIEKCHGFYKKEIAAGAAECEKLRDHLRSKLGTGKKINGTLADDLKIVHISENDDRQQGSETKLIANQKTLCSLATSNEILVDENLLMRVTFARLHRQLEAVREYGGNLLDTLGIDRDPNKFPTCAYSSTMLNLPVSAVIHKLRKLGETQTDAIIDIFIQIEKAFSTSHDPLQ